MKNILKTFGIIAIIAVIGFGVTACDNGGGGGGGGGGKLDQDGYGWVRAGYSEGWVFKANGDFQIYSIDGNGCWSLNATVVATWETSGNSLTITASIPKSGTFTYTISGDTMTRDGITYNKTLIQIPT